MSDVISYFLPHIDRLGPELVECFWQTATMVAVSGTIAWFLGVTIGVLLVITREGGLWEKRWLFLSLDKSIDILRTVDKMRKIGTDEVRKLLDEITGDSSKTEGILSFITAGDGRDFIGTLEAIEKLSGGPSEHSERMRTIYSMLEKTGIASSFVFDPSITRGLDYYTGIVYETFLDKLPSLGSVCSGGRYNDLASLYTKEKLPGVGSSIGLDRLMAGLVELGSPLLADSSAADVLIIHNADDTEKAVIAGEILRGMGIRTDIYLLPEAKMKRIYGYAEARHIPYSLQIKDGSYVLKNLGTREETSFDDLSQIREVIRID